MKRCLSLLICSVFIFSALCSCGSKTENDSLAKILEEKSLKIGILETNPPFSAKDEKGKLTGFDIDLANEVARRLDVAVTFVPVETENAIRALNDKSIDCYWSYAAPSRSIMAQAIFADSLYSRHQSVLVKKSSEITELVDLKGKKVGIQSGSTAQDSLKEASVLSASLTSVTEYENFEKLSAALSAGEIEAAVVDSAYSKYALIAKQPDMYTLLETVLSTQKCHMAFRLKDTPLKNKLMGILQDMKEDGTISGLSVKWFGEDITLDAEFNIKTAQ